MAPDKLKPNDPRVEHHTAEVNGIKYHYLLGNPTEEPVATILLIHGFPDLSFGWRYQVPLLLSLRLRVVVPDCVGYGRTDAPQELAAYSMKRTADSLVELAQRIAGPGQQILVGGHDWGGMAAWSIALWHPEVVRAVFSVCTPFTPPTAKYYPVEEVAAKVPNFAYQLQLVGPDVEQAVQGKEKLWGFLSGMFGGRTPNQEEFFRSTEGINLGLLGQIRLTPLLNKEEMDFYAEEYARNGIRGPLNWYRTRRINFDEERELRDKRLKIRMPSLMITASKDDALPPWMSMAMDRHFDNLTRREVNTHHWALWEDPVGVNKHIKEFLVSVLQDAPKSKL